MADYCQACKDLEKYSANYIVNGITSSECNSLKNNTGLNSSNKRNNCDDLTAINECNIGSLIDKLPAYNECDWKEFAEDFLSNQYNMNAALVCSDCGQWIEIENIWKEIENIYKEIDSLAGSNFVDLKKGTDYDLVFLNGWYSNGDDVRVQVSASKRNTTVIISGSASSPTIALYNDKVVTNTKFNHGAGDTETDYLKSRIFRIIFKGKYAPLNSGNTVVQQNQAIVNIRPLAQRASWSCVFQARKLNGGVEISMTSYADGYNNQLSYYCADDSYTIGSSLKMQYITSKSIEQE